MVCNSENTASFKLHSGHSSLPAQGTTLALECSHISSSKHLSPTVKKAFKTAVLSFWVSLLCGSWYLHTVTPQMVSLNTHCRRNQKSEPVTDHVGYLPAVLFCETNCPLFQPPAPPVRSF